MNAVTQDIDEGFRLHGRWQITYRIIRKDGVVRTVRDIGEAILDEHGAEVSSIGCTQDITESERAEQALSDSEGRYRQAAGLTNVGHWVWDEIEGKATFCSEEMARIHGVSVDEYIASTASIEGNINWAHPDDRERLARVHREAEEQQKDFDVEYRIITKAGEIRQVREIGQAVFDGEGAYVATQGVLQDVTDQKASEKALQTALADAEQANRSKSEFLATMSHELRTPLNAILGFSDILSEQYFGPPGAGKYREYATDIHHSGQHLLELVNDLLDISTIEAGKTTLEKEALSVKSIVEDCTRIIDEKVKSKNIHLETDVSDDLSSLFADKKAARQVLLNLLWNAVKFTPDGGAISITVKETDQEMSFIVADTGVGIPANKLPTIADPFTRSEADPHITEPGWGLGLAITKSLVELHDGAMNIASEVGKGTTVTVTFPSQERISE